MHLGGSLEEIVASEEAATGGEHAERPFILLVQPTLFDVSRAPEGKHTAWAYCHVPHGSTHDMSGAIEAQVERFAPGFSRRSRALGDGPGGGRAPHPNYVGGDINGGVQDLRQLFTRPVARLVPYSTPVSGLFICCRPRLPGGVHACAATGRRRPPSTRWALALPNLDVVNVE